MIVGMPTEAFPKKMKHMSIHLALLQIKIIIIL